MSATRDQATADEIAATHCEQARRHAERGDLAASADCFQRVLDLGRNGYQAEAALGLAAVRDGLGDLDGSRAAARLAMDSDDPEYAPRAAYHLAFGYERDGLRDEAAAAWQAVVDYGNEAYLPAAMLALARHADEDGDFERARARWERVASDGGPSYGPAAALELATRLVERGDPAAARGTLEEVLHRSPEPAALGELWTGIGVTHLEQAITAFRAAAGSSDAETLPLAVELLARTLPLRGRYDEASEAWQDGLHHLDPQVAAGVRARLRREFTTGDAEDSRGDADESPPWWESITEAAVSANRLPALTAEAFSALDLMYALVAVHYAQGADDLPEDLYEDLGQAVRVPRHYPWGARLHESFRERLRDAPGAGDLALPPDPPQPR